jgi:hypothetical protein
MGPSTGGSRGGGGAAGGLQVLTWRLPRGTYATMCCLQEEIKKAWLFPRSCTAMSAEAQVCPQPTQATISPETAGNINMVHSL